MEIWYVVRSTSRILRQRIFARSTMGILLLSLLAVSVARAGFSSPEVVSISAVTGQPGNAVSTAPGISSDGRYVVFHSNASDLVPGDTNGFFDIFVRDRVAGTTERVSVSSTGVQANQSSTMPSISGDGRYVVFQSTATNLTADERYGTFLHDRTLHTTELIGSPDGQRVVISQDGNSIAEWEWVQRNGSYSPQVVVYDRATKAMEAVSVSTAGQWLTEYGSGMSLGSVSVSPDGRFVAFSTDAAFPDDPLPSKTMNVYVRDRLNTTTTRVSVSSAGGASDGDSAGASVSPDGHYVAFYSMGTNLDGTDPNGNTLDLYLHDLQTQTTRRISTPPLAWPYLNDSPPAFSANARYMAFEQKVASGSTQYSTIFLYDLQTGSTSRVSASGGNLPAITADGSLMAYGSYQLYVVAQAPPLDSPANLTLNYVNPDNALASWSPVAGAASYLVRLNGTVTNGTSGTSVNFVGLLPGTTYDLAVTARDSYGNEGTSAHITFVTPGGNPGVSPAPTNLSLVEGGASGSYAMSLNTQPAANVTINLTAPAPLKLSNSAVTFTPTKWKSPQTISVTAPNNGIYEGPRTLTISHSAASTDPAYNGLVVPSVTVSLTDANSPVLTPPTPTGTGGAWTQPKFPLAGRGTPGSIVYVHIRDRHGEPEQVQQVIVGPDGTWSIDLVVEDCDYDIWVVVDGISTNVIYLLKDSTPPSTRAVSLPDPNSIGWYGNPFNLTLQATDIGAGTGVDRIEISLDGGGFVPYPASGIPVGVGGGGGGGSSIPGNTGGGGDGAGTGTTGGGAGGIYIPEGIHSICYRAIDNAGNAEPCHQVTLSVDTVPPLVTYSWDPWRGLTFSATDGTSGVDTIEYSVDDGLTWLPYTGSIKFGHGGRYTVRFRCLDKAGHLTEGSVTVTVVLIDPPFPAGTVWTKPNLPLHGTAPAGSTVKIHVKDRHSGADTVWINTMAGPDGTWSLILILDDCDYDVWAEVDGVLSTSFYFHKDSTPPVTQVTLPESAPGGWYGGPVTLVLQGTDSGEGNTGVAHTEISTDGGTTWQSYPSGGFSLTGDGLYTIQYRSGDNAGNVEAARSVQVGIDTVRPEVLINWNPDTETLTLTGSEQSSGIHSLEHSTDDGLTWQPYTGPIGGAYEVRFRCSDGAGNTTTGTIHIPKVTAPADQTGFEGTHKAFDLGSFVDTTGPWSVDVDWGDGLAHSTFNTTAVGALATQTHTYADNGTYTVKGRVTNPDGMSGMRAFHAVINNLPPVVGTITAPNAPVMVNTSIDISANFTDPGILDTHTAVIEWGDGSASPGTVTESRGSGSLSGIHTYTTSGVYTLKVTVTDKDGGIGSNTYQYVVVYDPDGGFVTGGGWINSPGGAYRADPTLTGRVNFGFVAKYAKGATIPRGQTEFQFKVGNMNFHSTAYEWLIVAGTKAQYKGSGTINGTGDYGFILTAVDGRLPGGVGQDRFRIKIWEKATGSVVYDNQLGDTDSADPTTVLAGGVVVIHS